MQIDLAPEIAARCAEVAAQRGLTAQELVQIAVAREVGLAGVALRRTADAANGASTNGPPPNGAAAGPADSTPPWAAGLAAAAQEAKPGADHELAFIVAWREVEPETLSAQDWELAVRLALGAGAHAQARALAAAGARRYPQDARLQERARILAPPRVINAHLPPDPSLPANHQWLSAHWMEHRGQWVALQEGQLLGTAPSLRDLREQLQNAGVDLTAKPFMTKIQ